MSVRYDPASHGQPRSLPATLTTRSAPVPDRRSDSQAEYAGSIPVIRSK